MTLQNSWSGAVSLSSPWSMSPVHLPASLSLSGIFYDVLQKLTTSFDKFTSVLYFLVAFSHVIVLGVP